MGFRKRGKQLKSVDLGELDGPLLIFGGVYSNLQALQALIKVADKNKIPPKNMICTGDVVAYCADAEGCVNTLRQTGCPVLMGNCEQQLGSSADNCGCGFQSGTKCDFLSVGWYKHANDSISVSSRKWMAALPERLEFRHSGKRYAVIHGGTDEIAKFIWPLDNDSVFDKEFESCNADVILAGHCGIPFDKSIGKKRWVNAGAIGMPAHDGSCETRFVIINKGSINVHKLVYDSQAAANQMVIAGLNSGYNEALISGYWPSEDILPKALRRQY